jgi:hypothetical protein
MLPVRTSTMSPEAIVVFVLVTAASRSSPPIA